MAAAVRADTLALALADTAAWRRVAALRLQAAAPEVRRQAALLRLVVLRPAVLRLVVAAAADP